MARILLLVILILGLVSYGSCYSLQSQYGEAVSTILHFEHIDLRDVVMEDVSNVKRGVAAFEEIVINLQAFGKNVTLNLVKNRELLAEGSMVKVYGENETLLRSYPSPLIAYKEKEDHSFHSRITIFDYDRIQMKGVWSTDEDTFYIDPVHEHAASMKRDLPVTVSHVIYRERDIMNNENSGLGKSYPHFVFPKTRGQPSTPSKRNNGDEMSPNAEAATALYPPPSPCPQTVKYFLQSVATDYRYFTRLGGEAAVRKEIINNWNVISALYVKAVNINIMLDEIVINTQQTTVEWNSQACPTIENMLYSFSQWRGTRNKEAGLWHLLTNCYPPPGTVGLAWVSVTCETNGGLPSGTGVSTYLSGSNGYRVSAHETGHNFGAKHEADGIMMASLQNVDFFSAATQAVMCNHINTKTTRCLKNTPINSVTTAPPTCVPSCSSKNCGDDGCGGTCGSCDSPKVCTFGVCQLITPPCTPNCSSKNCGDDGCGSTCGSCSSPQTCNDQGICKSPTPTTSSSTSSTSASSSTSTTSASSSTSTTSASSSSSTTSDSSSASKTSDITSKGISFISSTTSKSSNTLSSSTTSSSDTCIRSCAGKTCGFDGCSGSCGSCSYPQACNFNVGKCQYMAYNPVCTPNCAGKQCGFDGCGGTCGKCPDNNVCDIGTGLCETSFMATEEDKGANNTVAIDIKNVSHSIKNFSIIFLIMISYIFM